MANSCKYIKIPAVKPNFKNDRRTAFLKFATLEQLQNKELLEFRLPSLLEEFNRFYILVNNKKKQV